jgi:hypothetical protein
MAYQLERLTKADGAAVIGAEELRGRIERLVNFDSVRLRRLWAYYRNPMRACSAGAAGTSDRPYRQAQEWGLPARITGVVARQELFDAQPVENVGRKEVVIENDIGWRVDAMIDYLFGKPISIRSAAPDEKRRAVIEGLVHAIIAQNGGLLLLQQLALLGAVYGFVDVLVKLDSGQVQDIHRSSTATQSLGQRTVPSASASCMRQKTGTEGSQRTETPAGAGAPIGAGPAPAAEHHASAPEESQGGAVFQRPDDSSDTGARENSREEALIQRLARMVRLEIVEPARALPILSAGDYRVVEGYGQVYEVRRVGLAPPKRSEDGRWWQRLLGLNSDSVGQGIGDQQSVLVTEIITADRWQRYEDEALVAEGTNSLGEIPLVHIQNTAMPFEYSGVSDVEGLMPLQDELNTRLSDRANRIALQSFKMYLGKGIPDFTEMPVAPGRMWSTENTEADVIEFGGDESNPSESLHIADLREALDKSSGVSPIAAGAIKNRIGRLTSAAALKVTLISLLARTEKKRTTYGLGIQRMIELALAWLDKAGLFHTEIDERRFELHWPSPLPENDLETLQEAEIKSRLGVSKEVVLKELGY